MRKYPEKWKKKKKKLKYKDNFILLYYLPDELTSVSKVRFRKSSLCSLLNYLARRHLKTVVIQNRWVARPGLKHDHSFICYLTHKGGIILIQVSQHLIQFLYLEVHCSQRSLVFILAQMPSLPSFLQASPK